MTPCLQLVVHSNNVGIYSATIDATTAIAQTSKIRKILFGKMCLVLQRVTRKLINVKMHARKPHSTPTTTTGININKFTGNCCSTSKRIVSLQKHD